ncbi:carbohydrate sulfotransferase 10-like [Tubulanus polymorphus]|uniref:carbohydrate sulfotransferase 10-like n=1 Tax=Tubulanus polymorphus TaxID=672921 RepID=UPI003DA48223
MFLNDLQDELINAGYNEVSYYMLELYVLLYADDTVLIADSAEGLQNGLYHFLEYCPYTYTYKRFTVDDVHKILYCEIPKVGTSIWRYTLLHTTGKLRTTNLSLINNLDTKQSIYLTSLDLIRPLSSYSQDEKTERLKTYFKFLFVRHPFERLLSAYLDKILNKYYKHLPQKLIDDLYEEYKADFILFDYDLNFLQK